MFGSRKKNYFFITQCFTEIKKRFYLELKRFFANNAARRLLYFGQAGTRLRRTCVMVKIAEACDDNNFK